MQERETALGVFAIDPGPTQSAFVNCLFTGDTRLLGTPMEIKGIGTCGNHELLEAFADLNRKQIPAHWKFACEGVVFYGEQVHVGKSVFDTVRWCGRFEQYLSTLGHTLEFIPRQTIKAHVCNNTRAKDPDVRQALIDRFGAVGKKSEPGPLYGISGHCWSALAVAVAYSIRFRDSLRLNKHQPQGIGKPPSGNSLASECSGAAIANAGAAEKKFQQGGLI